MVFSLTQNQQSSKIILKLLIQEIFSINDARRDSIYVNYSSFVPNGVLSIYNSANHSLIHTICKSFPNPYHQLNGLLIGLALNKDHNHFYVTNRDQNTIYLINASTFEIEKNITLDKSPSSILFNPSNNLFYVANFGTHTVSVINSIDNSIIDTIKVGKNTKELSFNPLNNLLYVANRGNNTISVINFTDNSIVKTIQVGGYIHLGLEPHYLYYDTANNLLYVGIANTII